MMHPQQHLYEGLARPADYSIFAPVGESMAQKWTWPIYSQRDGTMLARDTLRDGQDEKMTLPLRGITSSSAIAERPRDASCLSVVSFNSTTRRA